jgi:probable HAF family extracellular repeat protein
LYCWFDGDPLAVTPHPHVVILNASTMAFVGKWLDNGVYGDAIAAPALGRNKRLYVATHFLNDDPAERSGRVYAIDVSSPTSPSTAWSYPTGCIGPIVSSPVIAADGKLYVCTKPGLMDDVAHPAEVICFDPSLAQPHIPIWSASSNFLSTGDDPNDPMDDIDEPRPIDGTPAIDSTGELYIPIDPALDSPTALHAINVRNIEDGDLLVEAPNSDWIREFNHPTKFDSGPIFAADGTVIAKTVDGFSSDAHLRFFSRADGSQTEVLSVGSDTLLWHEDPVNGGISAIFSSPLISPDGKIFVATAGQPNGSTPTGAGRLVCFSYPTSGNVFWPGHRANQYNTGNVQDNRWTTNTSFNLAITSLISHPTTGINGAFAVNNVGRIGGFQTAYASPNTFYGAAIWDLANFSVGWIYGSTLNTINTTYTSQVNGMNDLNELVGLQYVSGTDHRAVYWSGLTATPNELVRPTSWTWARAQGINDAGFIVGSAKNPEGYWRAMQWDAENLSADGIDRAHLSPVDQTVNSYAYGINVRGWYVGQSQVASGGSYRAFAAPGDRNIDPIFDNLSGPNASIATAMNGLGQIVGGSANGATSERAWIWYRNPDDSVTHKSLGSLYGGTSRAFAINNRGHVVGQISASGSTYAFIWVPGWTAIKDLRGMLTQGDALNWTQLNIAYGISDDGTVVGTGVKNGAYMSFAIRPKP